MANRRPIHRKPERRSASKTGLMLCIVLAGAVMLVPISSDFARAAKAKVRDLALNAGLLDLNGCVVTPDRAIACTSDAVGTPLPAALRQMEDSWALAAEEQKRRVKAESTLHQLALEVERLSAQAAQNQLADRATRFPPLAGDVTPTGLTGKSEPAAAAREPQSTEPEDAGPSFSLTPPPEGD